jgi:hypothetical protein
VGLRFSKCTGGSVDFVFGGPSLPGYLPTFLLEIFGDFSV